MRKTAQGRARGYSLIELLVALAVTLAIMGGVYSLMIRNSQIYEQQTRLADVQQSVRVAMDLMAREIRMAGADPSGRAFAPAPACLDGTYKLPVDPKRPQPADVAPLTVAGLTRIRVKMDRPVWVAPGQDSDLNPAVPPPSSPLLACRTPPPAVLDQDDEDGRGDGFLNDDAEDVEYWWTGTSPPAGERAMVLYRTERRTSPPAGCRPCPAPSPVPAAVSKQPIAENVVGLEFRYYSTEPPTSPCPPAGDYADVAAYEAAYNACDPAMTLDPACAVTVGGVTHDQPCDLSAVRRVRIRLVIESEKADARRAKTSPKFGKDWVTLATEVTLRNRAM